MIERMIRKYVENLKMEDIYQFAQENNIYLTDDEALYLYHTIKTKWENVVFGDPEIILYEAKPHLKDYTYKKVEELLYFYRNKYKHYL